jgi:hypothetical protein
MAGKADEYDARAAECERLATLTADEVLRDEILSLGRNYRSYAAHLRGAPDDDHIWPIAANA